MDAVEGVAEVRAGGVAPDVAGKAGAEEQSGAVFKPAADCAVSIDTAEGAAESALKGAGAKAPGDLIAHIGPTEVVPLLQRALAGNSSPTSEVSSVSHIFGSDRASPSASRRGGLSRDDFVEGILRGDRAMLSRAITLVESTRAADRAMADEIVEACLPHSGRALRVGITGVPGAGKSVLIEALGQHVIEECGQTVAVLAIDPTSQVTGGSILGDKTRMVSLAACDGAFIRPSPSRGSFGGVAQRTREAMLLCEAAGFANILVETVGVGQSETAVHDMVDFVVLVSLAGAGDDLQGIKRGVMELADLIVVNKADGDNVAAAERTRADAEMALRFFPGSGSGWTARAVACSALTGRGLAALWECAREFAELTKANGWLDSNRRQQRRRWLRQSLEQGVMELFRSHPVVRERVADCERDVVEGRMTPSQAARRLLVMYAEGAKGFAR